MGSQLTKCGQLVHVYVYDLVLTMLDMQLALVILAVSLLRYVLVLLQFVL